MLDHCVLAVRVALAELVVERVEHGHGPVVDCLPPFTHLEVGKARKFQVIGYSVGYLEGCVGCHVSCQGVGDLSLTPPVGSCYGAEPLEDQFVGHLPRTSAAQVTFSANK